MTMSQNFRVQTQFAKNNTEKKVNVAGCNRGCNICCNRGFALKVNKYRGFMGVQHWVQHLLQRFDANCKHATWVIKTHVQCCMAKKGTLIELLIF